MMAKTAEDMTPDEATDARVIGGEIDGPGKTFFENTVLDSLHDCLLELSAAVWTYRDRSIILEKVLSQVLSERGDPVDIEALVEAYRPTPDDLAQRHAERQELITNVFRSIGRYAR